MRTRKGQGSSEWGIAVLFITVTCLLAVFSLAPNMQKILVDITHALNAALSVQEQANSQAN